MSPSLGRTIRGPPISLFPHSTPFTRWWSRRRYRRRTRPTALLVRRWRVVRWIVERRAVPERSRGESRGVGAVFRLQMLPQPEIP